MKNKFTVTFLALMMLSFLTACSQGDNTNYQAPYVAPQTSESTPVVPLALTSEPTPSVDASSQATQGDSTSPVKTPTTSKITLTTTSSKDGQYSESVSYVSPGGTNQIQVSMTLKSGVVTALTVSGTPADPKSKQYISAFSKKISSMVVGKTLDSVGTFDRVGGASLTTNAFTQAMDLLKKNV